jgi:hypothetical protein
LRFAVLPGRDGPGRSDQGRRAGRVPARAGGGAADGAAVVAARDRRPCLRQPRAAGGVGQDACAPCTARIADPLDPGALCGRVEILARCPVRDGRAAAAGLVAADRSPGRKGGAWLEPVACQPRRPRIASGQPHDAAPDQMQEATVLVLLAAHPACWTISKPPSTACAAPIPCTSGCNRR